MRPLVLRRLKRQVATSIPAMKETVIDVELTTLQKQYYRAIFEKNREFLYRGCAGHVPQLVNVEMELRKCCQHPFLLMGVEESEADRIRDAIMAGESLGTLDELMLEEAEKVIFLCSSFLWMFVDVCGCLWMFVDVCRCLTDRNCIGNRRRRSTASEPG